MVTRNLNQFDRLFVCSDIFPRFLWIVNEMSILKLITSLSEEELESSDEVETRLLDRCLRFRTNELLSESEEDLRFLRPYRSCFLRGGLTGLYRLLGEWCFERRIPPFLWPSDTPFSANLLSLLFINDPGDNLVFWGESLFLLGSNGEKLLADSSFLTSFKSRLLFSLNDFLSS